MLFPETVGVENAFCRQCGAYYVRGEAPDPCIGRELPGIWGCCCGHGDLSKAYVDPDASWAEATATLGPPGSWNQDEWWPILERHRLTGGAAAEFLARHGCGPGCLTVV